ncbi:anthranilate phosphoribosyltransferase, partial [Physocladia obscura]
MDADADADADALADARADPRALVKKLLDTPDLFAPREAAALTALLMRGALSDAQAGAFLAALKLTKKDRDPRVIAECAAAMRSHALVIAPLPHASRGHAAPTNTQPDPADSSLVLVDIVGTGGDGQDTFNVSTAAAIVAAGAGCHVAKHGNRSSSSACGSADVIEGLGANLNNVDNNKVLHIINDSRFCFLFAQLFHPSMRASAAPRKQLGVKTIFN